MSISEKANDLLNKFGSAQFDFMVWNTPDNLVARDKARQEISDYIAELEAERRWIPVGEKPTKSDWYLIMYQGYGVPVAGYYHVDGGWLSDIPDCWMPLPELPERENER